MLPLLIIYYGIPLVVLVWLWGGDGARALRILMEKWDDTRRKRRIIKCLREIERILDDRNY